jgi:membrane protein involved in colicin uptake
VYFVTPLLPVASLAPVPQLYAEHQDAEGAWLSADAAFRSAVIAHTSATESADYAKSKFDKYSAAKVAGQAEWDSKVPGLDAEKAELEAQLPILEQVKTLVQSLAASAAKGKQVQLLRQLPALKKLANAVVPPRFSKDKKMAKQVMALRTSLAETSTGETASGMLTILDSIVSTMSARISEVGTTKDMMDRALKENIALFKHWEQQLVDLSDKADEAKNIMDTSDLKRQHLNGIHIVKQQAYEDYHAGFVDLAAKYQKQAKAIATITKKVYDAIFACTVPWAKEQEAADKATAEALAAAQKVAEEKAKADQLAAEAAAAAAKAKAETEAAAKAAAEKEAAEAAKKAAAEKEALDKALAAVAAAKALEDAAKKAAEDAKKAAQDQCCAGQCSLTSAPITNTLKSTGLTDRGGGENFYLDRQDVSCFADPMASFAMKSQGGQLNYEMQCATGADLDKVEVPC